MQNRGFLETLRVGGFKCNPYEENNADAEKKVCK